MGRFSRALLVSVPLTWGLLRIAPAPAIAFIQPRSHVVLAPPTGIVVPVQTRVTRDAGNRWWQLEWDGAGCAGSSGHSLDGADSAAVQPEDAPLHVRVGAGHCLFVAVVLGADGKARSRATFDLNVCGDEPSCEVVQ